MKCYKCGSELRPGLPYCEYCGTPVKNYRQQQQQQPSPRRTRKTRRNTNVTKIATYVLAGILAVTVLVILGKMVHDVQDRRQAQTAQAVIQTASPAELTAETESQAEPTPTPEPESEYLLENSSTDYLTDADLANLTHEELCLARNEIFARHGRMFITPQIQQYFNSKSWYHGTIPADQFNNESLTAVEKANVKLISAYEDKHFGGSYY